MAGRARGAAIRLRRLATRLMSPWMGLAHHASWCHRCQVRAAVVFASSAISVAFRARRLWFATVSHRSPDHLTLGPCTRGRGSTNGKGGSPGTPSGGCGGWPARWRRPGWPLVKRNQRSQRFWGRHASTARVAGSRVAGRRPGHPEDSTSVRAAPRGGHPRPVELNRLMEKSERWPVLSGDRRNGLVGQALSREEVLA
jgi:hypothetical protein